MKNMKNLFLLVVVMFVGLGYTSAQEKKLRAGVSLGYGSDDLNFGVGGDVIYSFNDVWEVALGFDHFFGDDSPVAEWNSNILDLDARFSFAQANAWKFYGAAGLSAVWFNLETKPIISGGTTASTSESDLGVNVGVGANWALGDFVVNPEIKYTFVDNGFFRIGVGLQYCF